jgi:hypothetical protein
MSVYKTDCLLPRGSATISSVVLGSEWIRLKTQGQIQKENGRHSELADKNSLYVYASNRNSNSASTRKFVVYAWGLVFRYRLSPKYSNFKKYRPNTWTRLKMGHIGSGRIKCSLIFGIQSELGIRIFMISTLTKSEQKYMEYLRHSHFCGHHDLWSQTRRQVSPTLGSSWLASV